MLKTNKRTLIVTTLVTLLPILAGLYYWDRLPDTVAIHFGMNNQPDGYTSKTMAVFGTPLLLAALEWAGAFVTSHDPRRRNISPKMFSVVLWLIPAVSLVSAVTVYAFNLGMELNVTFIAVLLMGGIFLVCGNYLPKARQSYTLGIRLPWTLANEENWNRTHRLAGHLWVAGGILSVAAALTGLVKPGWLVAAFLVMALVPMVYSLWLHTKRGL